LLLQAFYSIRSERQLVERIDHDLLFRWFVGLGIEDTV
jgi:transposase